MLRSSSSRLVAVVLVACLAACTAGAAPGEAGTSTTQTQRSPTVGPAPPSPTSEPSSAAPPTAGAVLVDGEHTGFVRGYDGVTIEFDPAPILTGDEAIGAARADGVDVSEGLPNDYYIPVGAGVVPLGTAPSFTVALIDNGDVSVTRDVAPEAFKAFLAGDVPDWAYASPDALFVTLDVSGGLVTSIRQYYLP